VVAALLRTARAPEPKESTGRHETASGLLPARAGQPVKALVHISFAGLCHSVLASDV
jgi:hypothetical protein